MKHKCGYCESELSSKQALEVHQNNAKKCLAIQKEFKRNDIKKIESILSKKENEIKQKYLVEITRKDEMIKYKDEMLRTKDDMLEKIELEKDKLEKWRENAIKRLEETTIRALDLASKMNGNTENSNNNNSFNTINNILVFSPNLSREKIQEICDNKITPETLMKEHGLADVYVDNVARNKDSEYGIVNTNKREPVLNYKDEKGEIRRDIGAMELTRNFRECAEIPINKHLKAVKKKVKDLMDYSVIEENVKNKDKLVKDISKKLHIDNVKKELLILKEKKEGKYIEEKKEIKENKEIKQLEDQLEELKSKKFPLDDIEISLDDFKVENYDKKAIYEDDQEHYIMVKDLSGKKKRVLSTYNKEKDSYIEEKKKLKQEKQIYKNSMKISELKEKIYKLTTDWYTKKREREQRKEEIKNQKKEKLELKATIKQGEREIVGENDSDEE